VGKQDVPSKEGDSSLLKLVRRHHEIPRDAHSKNGDPKYEEKDLWWSKTRPTRHSAYRPEKRDGVVEDEEQHVHQRDRIERTIFATGRGRYVLASRMEST
jgi:hypothetical protein